MTAFFDRKVRVVVGPKSADGSTLGVSIEDLRVTFAIEKTSARHPNKAKVEIYNLDPDVAAIFESSERRNTIQLFAGYADDTALIFQGEIRKGRAKTIMNGPDRITRIEASDGGDLYRSARLNKSFGREVTAAQIIDEIGRSFGVRVSLPSDVVDAAGRLRFTQGYVANGRTADVLQVLGDTLGFDAYFEDGALKFVSKNNDTGEQAVLLTPTTGLVDSPEKTNKGVNAISLLNPRIRPRRIVKIETPDEVEGGFYRVQKVGHKGDSGYSNQYYTEFEAVQIGGQG